MLPSPSCALFRVFLKHPPPSELTVRTYALRDSAGSAENREPVGMVVQELHHALALLVLYARVESPKFEAAAVRWLARLALEGRDVGLDEIQLAAAALGCLRGPRHERAAKTLSSLL